MHDKMAFTYCYKSDKIMDKLREVQIDIMCWLNDNDCEPHGELEVVIEKLGLIYSEDDGWDIDE